MNAGFDSKASSWLDLMKDMFRSVAFNLEIHGSSRGKDYQSLFVYTAMTTR
jgi:hypothetical protein